MAEIKKILGSERIYEGKVVSLRCDTMVLDNGAKAVLVGQVHTEKPEQIRIYYSVRLPLLTKGMEGEDVRTMQQLLLYKGYELPSYGADGEYGDETENALLLFQEDNGLKADAKCGQATWGCLLGIGSVG